MKIKKEIIELLRKNAELKRELLYHMSWSEPTLYRLLRENSVNSDLTKFMPIKIIACGLGMSETEILTEE
jgi:hypothetical protein